jgi:hypothetical protein
MDRSDIENIENISSEELIDELFSNLTKLIVDNAILSLRLKKAMSVLIEQVNQESTQNISEVVSK